MHPDRYDSLLTQLHDYAPLYPKYGFNLANHAPMVLDALWELGAADQLETWMARSIGDLVLLPRGKVLGLRERMTALGERARTADWIASFEADLQGQGVERTLRVALPLLTPGAMAASLHGVLRTAHALRALSRGQTSARLDELAHGLGSWAANHQLLPGLERVAPRAEEQLTPLEWLTQVPLLPEDQRPSGLLHEIVEPLGGDAAWLQHSRKLAPFEVSEASLHAIAAWSAERLALDPQGTNAHLHGVTVTSSLFWFSPWVDQRTLNGLARHVVLGLGAVHAASASTGVSECPSRDLPTPDQLLSQALASGDDHALKLTEAVLRIRARGLVSDTWLLRGAERSVRQAFARRAA